MRWRGLLDRSTSADEHDLVEIRKVARIVAEEIRRELESSEGLNIGSRVKLDVVDALRELTSGRANEQLQRFFYWNHRWAALIAERNRRTASETWDFIDETGMPLFVLDQFEVIKSKRDEILAVDGHILDLGVYKGASTRALARIFPDRPIHGFDSFEGLPDDWSHAVTGTFGEVDGRLPEVPSNVSLHKGWFDDTLGPWVREHDGQPIMLMRVDCDIYPSAKTILDELGPLITSGTWIVFDELIGYRGWRDHEYRALREFLDGASFDVRWIAHGLTYVLVQFH